MCVCVLLCCATAVRIFISIGLHDLPSIPHRSLVRLLYRALAGPAGANKGQIVVFVHSQIVDLGRRQPLPAEEWEDTGEISEN